MAKTAIYYPYLNISCFPTSNSVDEGKLFLEENTSAFVTRITNRNYALTEGSFDLKVDPDTTYGQVISVAPGQANIQGYHVITDSTLRIPPPTADDNLKSKNHIVLGMGLARDGSEHLRGDVIPYGESSYVYEGLYIGYFDFEDPMNPDIFILGYLDWDETTGAISNVVESGEKYGRLDAKDIIIYLSDPKHPEYEFLTLQELTDNLKDWYVSKIGDDEYGEILFRTPDKPTDPDNWGVSIVANNQSTSTITVKPSLVTDREHTITISSNYSRPMIELGDAKMWTLDNDMTINTVRDLILDAGRDIIGIAREKIENYIYGQNNLHSILTDKHFSLKNDLNANYIDFTIDRNDLKFQLGKALLDYSNASGYLTISGLNRLVVDNPAEFKSDSRMDQKLYFGPTSHTGSWIDKDNMLLTTNKNYTINLGDNSGLANNRDGLNIKSNADGKESGAKVENSKGTYVEMRTDGNNSVIDMQAKGNGQTIINFKGRRS